MQSITYNDFDAFSESVKGIECAMVPRNIESRRWSTDRLDIADLVVQFGRLGSGNIVEGHTRPNCFTLYLPSTVNCSYRANGSRVDTGSLIAFEPGADFTISTMNAHNWCAVFIPTSAMEQCWGRFREPQAEPSDPKVWVDRQCRVEKKELEHVMRAARSSATLYSSFEGTAAARLAADRLVELASGIFRRPDPDVARPAGRPTISRDQIIRGSKQLLESKTETALCIADLARAVKVSERTYRNAFKAYFGVGPRHYLSHLQLDQARRALEVSDPDEKGVCDILAELGIWEFGRFAGKYKAQFGEKPSETLYRPAVTRQV